MSKASINDPNHEGLELRVKVYLQGLGFRVGALTYHAECNECQSPILDRALLRLLQRDFSITSLYIRGRSDQFAIHPDGGCFLFEVKTRNKEPKPRRWHDVLLEALPLAHHVRSGVPCLYVFEDKDDDFSGGFWATEIVFPDLIMVPSGSKLSIEELDKTIKLWFPNTDVRASRGTGGSNDPYVNISEKIRDTWMPWERQIERWITHTAKEIQ